MEIFNCMATIIRLLVKKKFNPTEGQVVTEDYATKIHDKITKIVNKYEDDFAGLEQLLREKEFDNIELL